MISTTNNRNLMINSPSRVLTCASSLTSVQRDRLLHILESLHYHWEAKEEEHKVQKADKQVHVTFHNKHKEQVPIQVAFVGENGQKTGKPVVVAEKIHSGKLGHIESHPGLVFQINNAVTGQEIHKIQVNAEYGK